MEIGITDLQKYLEGFERASLKTLIVWSDQIKKRKFYPKFIN